MTEIFQFFWLILGTITGQIVILLIGYTILYFLPNNKNFPVLQKLSISYGLGTGFISLSMFICILIGFHSRVSFIPILIIILFLFFYFKIFKTLKEDIKNFFILIKNLRFNLIELFCIFLLIIELLYLFSYWFIYPIYTCDAIAVWDARGKYIFLDGNFNYFNYAKTNMAYPILVPLNLTFFYSIFFQYHYFAKILFVSYFIFLILFVYYSLRFYGLNKPYSLLISTLLALVFDLFFHATIAYADLTFTFFYTVSTIFLFYYLCTKKDYYLLYSSIFMGFMCWSKIEGVGLLFVNFGILIIYHIFLILKKRIDYKIFIKRSLKLFVVGILIFLPWQVFCIFNNLTTSYSAHFLEILDMQHVLLDTIIILNFLINFPLSWLFFWSIFFIVLLFNIKFIFNEKIFFLFLLCFFHFLLYIGIYIITPYDLEWQLQTSFSRELLHLIPICGYFSGILIAKNQKKLIDFREWSYYKIFVYFFLFVNAIFIIMDILFYDFVSKLIDVFYNVIISFI